MGVRKEQVGEAAAMGAQSQPTASSGEAVFQAAPGQAGSREAGSREAPARQALSREILEELTGVVKQAAAISHTIAARYGLTPSDLLALIKLDTAPPGAGMPMKELAHLIGCDASFVTSIADTLQERGLLRREPSQRDRRVKNLVLTPEGIAVKERLMTDVAGQMPWSHGLDDTERGCFLALLRKMVARTGARCGHQERPAR
jgi:MarR family transcriptional regulator, organic hydroperoxide resistance regulator